MNWFIGLPVDPLGWYPDRVPAAPSGLRPFHRDDLHLTVAFLGACGEDRARAAFEAMEWPLGPTEIGLGPVAPMGPRHRYSALSVLLDRGRVAIEAATFVARSTAFKVAAVQGDTRPPKAHVTIARPRREASAADRSAGLAWAASVDVRGVTTTAGPASLYTWSEDRATRLFRVVSQAGG